MCILYILSVIFHIHAHVYMDVVASVLKIKGDFKEALGVKMFLKNIC